MVFLAGYHAGPGGPFANMDPQLFGRAVGCLKISSISMNESTTNFGPGRLDYGVPVGLVIGDSGLRAADRPEDDALGGL